MTANYIRALPLKPVKTSLNHPTDPDFNSFNPELLKPKGKLRWEFIDIENSDHKSNGSQKSQHKSN